MDIRYNLWRILILATLAATFSTTGLDAQTDWRNCPTCYRGFKYDSTFRIGVLPLAPTPNGLHKLRDSLGFEFSIANGYNSPFNWNATSGEHAE